MTASDSPSPLGVAPRTGLLVDVGVLDGLVDMLADEQAVRELVQLLVDSLPERLQALAAADEEGDAEALRGAAHALKSVADQLGATALAIAAAAVEAGRDRVDALEPLVPLTIEALRRWRGDDVAVEPLLP